ncbi:MAG: hypothetical protein LZF62_180042 [Nitrospira sp.]|nr:MAG: hypothetical protein LZF62_180042 [Nitrospira sp.]
MDLHRILPLTRCAGETQRVRGTQVPVPNLIDLDGDGLLLGLFGFRHANLQHTILKRCLHLIGLDLTRQTHCPCKEAE